MKRVLLTIIIVLFSLCGLCAPHGKYGKNLAWHYDVATQTLYVTGTGELPCPIWGKKKKYDPGHIRGKKSRVVKNVCLSEGITSIGKDVFRDCTIEDFTMPASLESGNAFYGCSIERLHYKGTLEQWLNGRIAERCLQRTRRVDRVFVGGKELAGKIAIPHTVTHIPAYALSYKVITSLILPNTVTSVDYYAFSGSKIDTVNFLGTLDQWCTKDYAPLSRRRRGPLLIQGRPMPSTVQLSATVTHIADYAFYQQSQLTSVQLPANLQTIGDSAFCGTGLQRIDLPKSLQKIGKGAFGRTKIYRVTWRMPQYEENIDIFNKRYINYFTFTETVRTIPDDLCYKMNSLWNLTIENGVTKIGSSAFEQTNIEQLILPPSVTYIGADAFRYCSSLRLVTVPNSTCYIYPSAFKGCDRLTRTPKAGITVDDSRQKEKLPEMHVLDKEGRNVNMSPKLQDGHMTMLLFDASWCSPSRRMLKYIEAHWDQWKAQYPDLQLVLVLSHDSPVKDYISFGEQYWDPKKYKETIMSKHFNFSSYPFLAFFDGYGKPITAIRGYNPDGIEEGLKKTYESK